MEFFYAIRLPDNNIIKKKFNSDSTKKKAVLRK